MSVAYEIISELGIVYVRYRGVANVHDTLEVFGQFAQDPAFSTDLKHLVDLEGVVEYERSFVEMMALQARKAETLTGGRAPAFLIYYAPTRISQSMARLVLKSWDGLGAVVARMATDEAQALEMLGLHHRSFAELPMKLA